MAKAVPPKNAPPLAEDVTETLVVMQVETEGGNYDAYTFQGDDAEERGRILLDSFRTSGQRTYRLIRRTTTSRDELLA